jgi:hypothetical protein
MAHLLYIQISQKIKIFLTTIVRTSNPTRTLRDVFGFCWTLLVAAAITARITVDLTRHSNIRLVFVLECFLLVDYSHRSWHVARSGADKNGSVFAFTFTLSRPRRLHESAMSSFDLTRHSTRPMKTVNVAPQDPARNCVSWKVQLVQDAAVMVSETADSAQTVSSPSFLMSFGNYHKRGGRGVTGETSSRLGRNV